MLFTCTRKPKPAEFKNLSSVTLSPASRRRMFSISPKPTSGWRSFVISSISTDRLRGARRPSTGLGLSKKSPEK
jgi:hypothetical protein